MGVLGILCLFAGLISTFIAVVFLCNKSMRTKAGPFVGFGLFAIIVSGFALGSDPDFSGADTGQTLGDFPDRSIQASAAEVGITRYEAYRLLKDQTAISAYCVWEAESYKLDDQLQAAIDGGGDATTLTAQGKTMQESLLSAYNGQLGLEKHELSILANAGLWALYCRANEEGLPIFDLDDAKRVTRVDAAQTNDSLMLAFIDQHRNGGRENFFNQWNGEGAAICQHKKIDGLWFIGCRIRDIGRESRWMVHLLGKEESSETTLVYPINGRAKQIFYALEQSLPQFDSSIRRSALAAQLDINGVINRF